MLRYARPAKSQTPRQPDTDAASVDDLKQTRWSDGRTTQDITDKQHHVKVDNIYQYDVYKVKYLVHDIYDHYVCHHCKHDERSYNPKYEELSREYLRSYTGY